MKKLFLTEKALTNRTQLKQNTFMLQINQLKLENTIVSASKYYNQTPIINDEQFDILFDYLEKNYPNSKILNKVGIEIDSKFKTELPIFLPSMEKIKPDTNSLIKWQVDFKGPYVLSDKLDGMSLLVVSSENNIKAFTRGDGKIGQDISWIIPYINIGKLENAMVRGELVVSKENWETIKSKYPKYSNARNFVSGYTGRNEIDPKLMKFIDFVVYEYIPIDLKPISLKKQLEILKKAELTTVYNILATEIDNNTLAKEEKNQNMKLMDYCC